MGCFLKINIFSCTELEISALVALTYTRLYSFIPIYFLKVCLHQLPDFIQSYITKNMVILLLFFPGCWFICTYCIFDIINNTYI